MDLFKVSLDNKLKILKLGLQINLFKIEEIKKNLLLFKSRLFIGIFIDNFLKLKVEKKLTIVIDLMEAIKDKDVLRIKLTKDFFTVSEKYLRITISVFQYYI